MLWFKHVGTGLEDGVQRRGVAPAVRDEHLDRRRPGVRSRMALMVAAMAPAPPSARSSRATQVTTAWPSRIRSTAWATRSGSSGDSGRGWRVSTWQNPQARVQRSPLIMNVAVPSAQHS